MTIRSTLLYFDMFEYPLDETELFRFMPSRLKLEDFKQRLHEAGFPSSNGFYQLDSQGDLSLVRIKRQKKARAMIEAAMVVGAFIRFFPFVRAAFLSGSLSKGVNDGTADVDLFLVSADERIWICRSVLTAFKRTLLFNSKKFLCPNYIVAETHLEIPDKNIFTATELATLKPLYNREMLRKLISENKWVYDFYPNLEGRAITTPPRRSIIQKAIELPMSDGYAGAIDKKLAGYYGRMWKRRYPGLRTDQYELLFRSTPIASKVHPRDYQTKVLHLYEARLALENLSRLTRIDG